MRILYYVPIIHTSEEYGVLSSAIRQAFICRLGEKVFEKFQEEICAYWRLVEARIKKTVHDFDGLIIYQDSFPVGSREKVLEFFGHLFRDHPQKSPNFNLVKKLLDKGAILEGTEDMNLVLEQMKVYQLVSEASSPLEQNRILAENATHAREVMRKRDVFIAQRICVTLPGDGRGILFIGRDHDVTGELAKLPEKIRIISL
ncbi:MAG: hypothetical protein AAB672_00725 [Patescibacteria group bacterium]